MADRRDAADRLPGVAARTKSGSARLTDADPEQRRDLGRVHAVCAARQDEQRRAVGVEDQAVGDGAYLAAELRGRRRGGRRGRRQFPHLAADSETGSTFATCSALRCIRPA